jgi:hypothetical protein
MSDPSWFADLQEALVMVFTPILWGVGGVVILGSILAALTGLILDAVGLLFKR